MTGRVQDWNRQSMKKDGSTTTQHGVRSTGSLFHSSAPVMLADGGSVDEAAMKQRGLEASNKEKPTGFFQRLREGNIDDPKSMAYQKYGAGRGKAEAALDSAEAEMKANQANARSGSQAMRDDADFDAVGKQFSGARAVAGAPAPVEVTPVRQGRVDIQRVDVPAPTRATSASNDTDAMRNRSRKAAVAAAQARKPSPAPAERPGPTRARAAAMARQASDIEGARDKRFVGDVINEAEAAATRLRNQ